MSMSLYATLWLGDRVRWARRSSPRGSWCSGSPRRRSATRCAGGVLVAQPAGRPDAAVVRDPPAGPGDHRRPGDGAVRLRAEPDARLQGQAAGREAPAANRGRAGGWTGREDGECDPPLAGAAGGCAGARCIAALKGPRGAQDPATETVATLPGWLWSSEPSDSGCHGFRLRTPCVARARSPRTGSEDGTRGTRRTRIKNAPVSLLQSPATSCLSHTSRSGEVPEGWRAPVTC